jgi:polysaccharide pyruvyl transferase WcaK-like protein
MSKDSPLFILAGNGPYKNRGCEAIVRGTVKILRNNFQNPAFVSVSVLQKTELEQQVNGETDPAITHKKLNDEMYAKKRSFIQRIISLPFAAQEKYLLCNEMMPFIDGAAAVLSVGGDNYSLDYGIPRIFTDLDDVVLEKKRPLILWGASVGPFFKLPDYEQYMKRHLKKVTAIFARESVTQEYLSKLGITELVYPVADPAFLMESQEPNKEHQPLKIQEGAIGLNLSPRMAKYVTGGDESRWERVAADIVSKIEIKTGRPIYLVPHVTIPGSDDFTFMEKVLQRTDVHTRSRITLVPPWYTAAETKWILSKMSLFAGARTHATIAALSSNIPTLSFGYSIKAKGINRDIFGHDEYCLNPDQLTPESVIQRIESLLENRSSVKNELIRKIPLVQDSAMMAGTYLTEILNRS